MKIQFSEDFKIIRHLQSVAPSKITDFKILSSSNKDIKDCFQIGIPIIYSIDFDEGKVLITFHNNIEELLNASFFFQGQIKTVKAIAIINIKEINKMFDLKKVKPIFLVSPGRVGSTLVSNIFKYGGVKCLSEPDVLSSFKKSNYNKLDQDNKLFYLKKLEECIESYNIFLQKDSFIIKLRSYSSSLVPLFNKIDHEIKYIFLFRNIEKWATSMIRTFNYKSNDLQWVLEENFKALRLVKEKKIPYLVINYDNLIEKPEETVSYLAKFINPIKFDEKESLKALEYDSQSGTGIEKDKMNSKKYSEDELINFLDYWRKYDKSKLKDIELDFLYE